MQTFFNEYLNILQKCHNDILEALEGLPLAALDWTPGPDTNSISVLVTHLAGAERYWIGDVAAQDPTAFPHPSDRRESVHDRPPRQPLLHRRHHGPGAGARRRRKMLYRQQ